MAGFTSLTTFAPAGPNDDRGDITWHIHMVTFTMLEMSPPKKKKTQLNNMQKDQEAMCIKMYIYLISNFQFPHEWPLFQECE